MYEPFYNSLLINTTTKRRDDMQEDITRERKRCKLDESNSNFLGNVSSLYIYTNTPPHAYGTQAPKVAETVLRAYSFNRKRNCKKTIKILDRKIERLHWEIDDGDFPFNEVHGNFVVPEARAMCIKFLEKNHVQIDRCADKVMKQMISQNADILTKGRQTYCPFSGCSISAPLAYEKMHKFLSTNSGISCVSCLEWIQAYFITMGKEIITYETFETRFVEKRVYNKETKQFTKIKIEKKRKILKKTANKEETQKYVLDISTKFASYLKDKERGKKDRRAIASANMILRMFLQIIEEFHLSLSKEIEGSTIAEGGDAKKAKINNNMSGASTTAGKYNASCQGTEDATKWNECLSPALFGLMHKYLFSKDVRKAAGVSEATEFGLLFSKIAVAGNFLMSMKQIQLGKGLMVYNENEFSRLKWCDEWYESMNERTKEWYKEISNKISEDKEFVEASPGMLMGMMNAGSTTLGLLATNYKMDMSDMKVVTMRSSDDSMSRYSAIDANRLKMCVEQNRRNLAILGINLSPDKTFFFPSGYGEYTSWYCDGAFVSQFGVKAASLRAQGKNPPDDFYAIAKSTAIAQSTLTINPIGATARLKIGIDNVRRLWRIKHDPDKREGISGDVLLLSDGGNSPWDCTNCHLEETCIKERFANNNEEKNYLKRVRNPDNPFSGEPIEEVMYSINWATDTRGKEFMIRKVKQIEFLTGQPDIAEFKNHYAEEPQSICLKKRFRTDNTFNNIPFLYTEPLPIETKKLIGWLQLCKSNAIPSVYPLYNSLKAKDKETKRSNRSAQNTAESDDENENLTDSE